VLGSGDAWVAKQWIIRPFTAKLFSKQLLLLTDDFGVVMIDRFILAARAYRANRGATLLAIRKL
jgi:hypothetical protein